MSDDLVTRLKAKASDPTYKAKPFNLMMDAADLIIAQRELIQEMREALEAIYRHIDSPENYDRHIDAICDSALSKAKSQQEGETE